VSPQPHYELSLTNAVLIGTHFILGQKFVLFAYYATSAGVESVNLRVRERERERERESQERECVSEVCVLRVSPPVTSSVTWQISLSTLALALACGQHMMMPRIDILRSRWIS